MPYKHGVTGSSPVVPTIARRLRFVASYAKACNTFRFAGARGPAAETERSPCGSDYVAQ